MRIGFPLSNLPLHEAGGIETYCAALIHYLQEIDGTNEYTIFLSSVNEKAFPVRSVNFKKIILGSKHKSVEIIKSRGIAFTKKTLEFMGANAFLKDTKRAAKNIILKFYKKHHPASSARINKNTRHDILHFMLTTFPYWENFDIPVILTIHDIQQEYYPEFFSKDNLENRRRLYKPSAEKADHIIAISHFTKQTLVEKYGIPEDKISVVYNGYDEKDFKVLENKTVEKFRIKYNLPENFLFYPAATWVHKNHLNLLRAFKILKKRCHYPNRLVLTGIKKDNYEAVKNEINRLGLSKDVIFLGYLPYGELPALFNAASMLVFPSLFEGFGIPVVEAMAVGLPVVCSNTTSLPEVAGEAALYFDPNKPEDIAEKVFTLHENNGLRDTLVRRGFTRARIFKWKHTAEETLKVYEKVYRTFKAQ